MPGDKQTAGTRGPARLWGLAGIRWGSLPGLRKGRSLHSEHSTARLTPRLSVRMQTWEGGAVRGHTASWGTHSPVGGQTSLSGDTQQ